MKQTLFTQHEYCINTIRCVISSTMPKGTIDNTGRGRHSHCLVYVLCGTTEYMFDGKSVTVKAGDVLFLAKNARYHMRLLEEKYSVIFVDFFLEEDRDPDFALSISQYRPKNTFMIENVFRRLLHLWLHKSQSRQTACKSALYEIYSELIESEELKQIHSSKKKKIALAESYILEHYTDEDISIEYLAKLSEMSAVHFRRLFSEIHSVAPVKYITGLKVARAKEMLHYERVSITDIAESLGYSSIFYFCKSFKKETGLTPSEFKRLYAE